VTTDDWPKRQRAIAHFATAALRNGDFEQLIAEACVQVAAGLGVPMAKLAILKPESEELLLRAQVGLPADVGIPGQTVVPGGAGSAMGYCLQTGAPVISDVDTETRFEPSEVVRRSGVKISANVVIWIDGRPYGCLEADATHAWKVTESDIDFLQTFADVVSAAIERNLLSSRVGTLAHEREILLNEVFHRIKNLLANVLAIARRTAKYSASLPEFHSAFEDRIQSLARAHDLLLTQPGRPARLRELLELEFGAKALRNGKEFELEGPDILCSPRTIQMLALLVFELATNAVKHGALSESAAPSASIHVRWQIEERNSAPALVLNWRERGVKLPAIRRRGFGSELLERLVPQMLGGTARLDTHDDGIECLIVFPLLDDQNFSTAEPGPRAAKDEQSRWDLSFASREGNRKMPAELTAQRQG
jgi:two-component sensor histidine kinase